jgi:hypothetical protein
MAAGSPNGRRCWPPASCGCGAALAAPGALSLLATTFPPGGPDPAWAFCGAMAGLGSVAGCCSAAR